MSPSNSIVVKSPDEIEVMREANQHVATVLQTLINNIEPGQTTWELDKLAEDYCKLNNLLPAFKGYRGFPGCLCVSINDEVVHGIPSRKRKLKKGDIISVDFGVKHNGFYGDSAVTIPVGKITANAVKLLDATEKSLQKGIAQAVVGNRISDISTAVQQYAEDQCFSVVRQFVGHGIGRDLHEAPEIPNFYDVGSSPRLLAGMVLAIEPMLNAGTEKVKVLRDGWTVKTADNSLSAHFEHTIAVTEQGPIILSSRK
ncbi:MAG: type I methionyl aminopeptidase [Desulfotalea sp.]